MLNAFDAEIIGFLNRFALRSWTFDSIVVLVEANTLLKGGLGMTVFWWLWFRRKTTIEERQFLLFGLVTSFVSVLLARAFALLLPFRERPLRAPLLHFHLPYSLSPDSLIRWSSFPSDHATLFFSLVVTFFFISRTLGFAALAYTCVVICLPRLYLGIHYPTDILAGALLGVLVALLGRIRDLRSAVTAPLLKWAEVSQASAYAFLFVCTFSLADQFESVRQVGKFALTAAKFTIHRSGRL
jgi:undecaprenyl-diphosphatase